MLNSMAHLMKWAPWQLEQSNMGSELGGVGGGMNFLSSPDALMLSREQQKQGRGDLAQERNSSAQGEQSVADPALRSCSDLHIKGPTTAHKAIRSHGRPISGAQESETASAHLDRGEPSLFV